MNEKRLFILMTCCFFFSFLNALVEFKVHKRADKNETTKAQMIGECPMTLCINADLNLHSIQ